MKQDELLLLLNELRSLPVESEWLEFKEARNQYPFSKLGRYFSAIANEANLKDREYGWLIFGIEDKNHDVVGTAFRDNPKQLESLKREVADKTSGRITFLDIFEVRVDERRVLMLQIPAAPRGMPVAWEGHYFGRDGESTGPLSIDEIERIRQQSAPPDWTSAPVMGATLADLSPEALIEARRLYSERNLHLNEEMKHWNDAAFLRKLHLLNDEGLNRAALLLLGRAEAATKLPNTNLQISWIVQDSEGMPMDYYHFGLPFLLNSSFAIAKIRNLTYRYMPDNSLFPAELPKYDGWVLREALHNCIAHQDYALGGKINLVEKPDELIFNNLGDFIPTDVESVIKQDVPPERYRNPALSHAMVELKMMDTIGSGIKRMFRTQRERLFPLPEYMIDRANRRVEVRIIGQVLNEKYTRLLRNRPELTLEMVVWLDAVQKSRPISDSALKQLRALKFVEGRKPNIFLSASVAQEPEDRTTYTKYRGLDKDYYKQLVIKHIRQFGSASRTDINRLLYGKLSSALTPEQQDNQIRNLLTEMRSRDKTVRNVGSNRYPKWVLHEST